MRDSPKPWNHPPGKQFWPWKPKEQSDKTKKKREQFDKNWDACFDKKKLNNVEDHKDNDDG